VTALQTVARVSDCQSVPTNDRTAYHNRFLPNSDLPIMHASVKNLLDAIQPLYLKQHSEITRDLFTSNQILVIGHRIWGDLGSVTLAVRMRLRHVNQTFVTCPSCNKKSIFSFHHLFIHSQFKKNIIRPLTFLVYTKFIHYKPLAYILVYVYCVYVLHGWNISIFSSNMKLYLLVWNHRGTKSLRQGRRCSLSSCQTIKLSQENLCR
jgi:hypothetical protein